jgi:HK97 family phage portal protein
MKLLDAFKGMAFGWRFGSSAVAGSAEFLKSAGSDWIDRAFRTGLDTRGVDARITEPYRQHATLHRAMKVFAQNVARVPLEFFSGETVQEAKDDVPTLFRRPNALMRGTDLIKSLALDYQLFGDAIWWVGSPSTSLQRNRGRIPDTIRRLDPRKVQGPELNEFGEPTVYTLTTTNRAIPAEEIIHFRDLSPYDEKRGIGWVDAAMSEIETDFFAQAWNRRFFLQGAVPEGILQPKAGHTITDPQAEKIRLSFLARHQGLTKAHAPAILPGSLEYVKTGIGQKEMDFAGLRDVSRQNVLSAGGTPPAVAGIMQFANYANMAPQLRLFFEFDVIPFLHFVEAVIQADFLDRLEIPLTVAFKVDVINSLLEDLDVKTNVALKLFNMGVTMDEINDRLELGLDLTDSPTSDQSFLPFSVQPAEFSLDEPEPAPVVTPVVPAADDDDADDDDADADDDDDAADDDDDRKVIPITRSVEAKRTFVWRALSRIPRSLTSRAEVAWRSHLRRLLKETLKNLAAVEAASKSGRPGRVRIFPGDEESAIFDVGSASQESKIILEPIWRGSMLRGSDSVSAQIGINIAFDFLDPLVIAALDRRRVRIVQTTQKMAAKLRVVIGEATEAGLTEEDTRQRVLDFFSGRRRNARTIARTEVHSSFSEGRFQSMAQADIKRIEWLTSRDALVRDDHIILDTEATAIGEPFSNGLMYPLDPAGPPEEVINCRCQAVPVGSII